MPESIRATIGEQVSLGMRIFLFLAGYGVLVSPLGAQDIPPYVPVNPVLQSRSALYAQPHAGTAKGWQVRTITDYTNAVETSTSRDGRDYVLDAELLQVDLWLTRDVSSKVFVIGNVALRSGHAGYLDGFLNWYHDVIGLRVPARNRRTENRFTWEFELDRETIVRERGAFIGDARLGGGVRIGERVQAIATVTLPTATTGSEGWSRKTVGTSLAISVRAVQSARVALDLGASVGYTPTHGDLARYQRSGFGGGMVAGRWRFAGRQAVFATLWGQTPNWRDTGFGAMDRAEATLDFGALLQVGGGFPEIQLGLTEDLLPRGPAVDIGFKIGARW